MLEIWTSLRDHLWHIIDYRPGDLLFHTEFQIWIPNDVRECFVLLDHDRLFGRRLWKVDLKVLECRKTLGLCKLREFEIGEWSHVSQLD